MNDDKSWQACGQHWSGYNWTALRNNPTQEPCRPSQWETRTCISRVLFKQGVRTVWTGKNKRARVSGVGPPILQKQHFVFQSTRHAYFSPHDSDLSVALWSHTHCDKHISMCSLLKAVNQSSLGTIKAEMRCDYYYTKYCAVSVPFFSCSLCVLLLVTDECFMALQSCAHSLDTLMGPLIPVRLFFKTDWHCNFGSQRVCDAAYSGPAIFMWLVSKLGSEVCGKCSCKKVVYTIAQMLLTHVQASMKRENIMPVFCRFWL